MLPDELRILGALIRGQRTAALGTLSQDGGAPYVSHVLYAVEPDLIGCLLHLSRLAVHTRNLQADGRAGLLIAEPDMGASDPQTLLRLSLQGEATPLAKDAPGYGAARALYLARFPEAGPIFDLGDFDLYRFLPREGRFIAAFGRILNVTADHLRQAAAA